MVLIDPVFQGEVGEDIGALRNEDLAHRVPENSKCSLFIQQKFNLRDC